jgi:hypothetical protein
MSRTVAQGALVVAGAIACFLVSGSVPAHTQAATGPQVQIDIPRSVRAEHEMLHVTLLEATKAPGRTGAAARALAAVLEPHYDREEQMAMQVLGLLKPLADGTPIPDAVAAEGRRMSDTLRREMKSMLDDHKKVGAAVEALRLAAVAEKAGKFQLLAESLALDSRAEEEILYPAAVLVGELLRARQGGK